MIDSSNYDLKRMDLTSNLISTGMCSIAYEPCDENSFKIGPPVQEGT